MYWIISFSNFAIYIYTLEKICYYYRFNGTDIVIDATNERLK